MIFNGVEKDYVKVNMGLFRPPTPPIEFNTTERRRGGSKTRKKRFTDMTLPVPVTIRSDQPIEYLKEEISDWLYHEEPKKLIFKQIPDRYYLAEYESMELNERHKYAKGTIYFYLALGYRFGENKTLNVTSSNQSFNITGQEEAPWQSETVFDDSTSQYKLESNTGKIILNFDFVSGDVLRIDYKTRSITLNGVNIDVGLSLNSEWFDLNPGYMTLSASDETELTYTERFY